MTSYNQSGTQPSILVPVDFSAPARAAVQCACRLAQRLDLPVTVLHILHESSSQAGFYRKHDSSQRMLPLDEIAEQMVLGFLTDLQTEDCSLTALSSARIVVVPGLPGDRIPEVANREGAAMIIMGTHARNRFARLFHSCVATEVTRRSTIPVITIKNPENGLQESDLSHQPGIGGDWWSQPVGPRPSA